MAISFLHSGVSFDATTSKGPSLASLPVTLTSQLPLSLLLFYVSQDEALGLEEASLWQCSVVLTTLSKFCHPATPAEGSAIQSSSGTTWLASDTATPRAQSH